MKWNNFPNVFLTTCLLIVLLTPSVSLAAESDNNFFCDYLGWLVRPIGFCSPIIIPQTVVVNETEPVAASVPAAKPTVLGVETDSQSSSTEETDESVINKYITIQQNGVTEALLNKRVTELLVYINSLPHLASVVATPNESPQQKEIDSKLSTKDYILKSLDKVYDNVSDSRKSLTTGGEFNDSTLNNPSLLDSMLTGTTYVSGRLGIGTSTPPEPLSLNGAMYLSSSNPAVTTNRLYNYGGSLYWNGSVVTSSTTANWSASGGDVFRLSGNVGVGTSSPYAKLSVAGDIALTGALTVAGSATSTFQNGIQLSAGCFRNADGVCVGGGKEATYIVAASNSINKDYADYKADGTADQVEINAAIQAAYSAVRGTGGKVYLLEGDYSVTGTTTMATGTTLMGSGQGTIIKLADGVNSKLNIIDARNISNITIADLTIDGNKGNNSEWNYGVWFTSVNTSTIRNLKIVDMSRHGIMVLSNSSYNTIVGNAVTQSADSGFWIGSYSTYNTISNNISSNNGNNGFIIYWNSNNTITDNVSSGNFDGIWLENSRNITISGNIVSSSTNYGITLSTNSNNNIVTSNTIASSTSYGIQVLSGSKHNTISSNSLYANGSTLAKSSIYLNDGDNNLISSNNIQDTAGTGYAIEILANSTGNTLVGNKYSGTGATTISDLASDTRYTQSDRLTLDTKALGEVGYSLFTITGSSSLALSSSTQLGTGKVLSLNNALGEVFTVANNGNVGIGTSSPLAKLTIQGTAGSDAVFNVASSTGASLLTVLANGYVGIGTTTPGKMLEVSDTARFRKTSHPLAYTDINGHGIYIHKNSAELYGDPGLYIYSDATVAGQFYWDDEGVEGVGLGVVPGAPGVNKINLFSPVTIGLSYETIVPPTEGLLVKGNVGIGTTAPSAKLTIQGTAGATDVFKVASSTGSTTLAMLANGNLELPGQLISAGIKWEARTAAEDNEWRSVTYGNGLFVAVAQTGTNRVMTSPDGITWTARMAPEVVDWQAVTYGNGLFVAVGETGTNRVMTSPDGITWTARATEASKWNSVVYGNGVFVSVAYSGTNRVMTSPDGITWTARSATESSNWLSVTYGNDIFVAVSQTGTNRVMTSPDGITWTARSAAEANSWRSVTYGNSLFVAVAWNDTANQVMTSPDGINWTPHSAANNNAWYTVFYANGLFVSLSTTGSANQVMTSPDGANWTIRDTVDSSVWHNVAYGNGRFVAVAKIGTIKVMTSGQPLTNALTHNNIYQGGMSVLGGAFNIGTTTAPTNPAYNNAFNVASTTGASLFTITGAGNVGIASSSPNFKLTVAGTVAFDGLTGTVGAGSLCLTANKEVVYNSGSDNCLSSTRASKHDIEELSLDAMSLSAMVPVSFIYNNDASSTVRYGFIAEDMAAIDAHLATYNQAGEVSGLDTNGILAMIVTTVQDLMGKIAGFADSFTSKFITAEEELCVGNTCFTEQQLQQMLEGVNQPASSQSSNNSNSSGTSDDSQTEDIPPTEEVIDVEPEVIEEPVEEIVVDESEIEEVVSDEIPVEPVEEDVVESEIVAPVDEVAVGETS